MEIAFVLVLLAGYGFIWYKWKKVAFIGTLVIALVSGISYGWYYYHNDHQRNQVEVIVFYKTPTIIITDTTTNRQIKVTFDPHVTTMQDIQKQINDQGGFKD